MSILVVVAHPDDEVLGCGGTIAALCARGLTAHACILSGEADARENRPDREDLLRHTEDASRMLGMNRPILGSFPNLRLNTVPHLELVRFVEAAIVATAAQVLFTHHPADLNNDHLHVSLACQAASRLWQRRPGIAPLRALYYMEILSSTDWAFQSAINPFRADAFMSLSEQDMRRKRDALAVYEGVMRPAPHSRSVEAITASAVLRGAQAFVPHAEAFQVAYLAMDKPNIDNE